MTRRVTTRLALTGLLALLATFAVSCSTGGEEAKLREAMDLAVETMYPPLVRIHVVTTSPSGGRLMKLRASGSGAIISPEGHVITNHHVAGKATHITCRLWDRDEVEAELVGTDPMTDIAVLKLRLDQRKDPNAPVPVAQFGDSETVAVGDTVLAMGSPGGLSQSVTAGVVSNVEMILPYGDMELDGEPVGVLVRWIGHDAQIWSGNSGGPLVNLDGKIVGINEVGLSGLGGAIPSNLARSVAEQIIEHGRVERSWMGIEPQPLLKDSPVRRGVLVGGILPDSPALEADLEPGDVITRLDGMEVHASVREELPLVNQVVLSTPVGKTVTIHYLRNGEARTTELTTVPRPPAQGRNTELRNWGVTAMDFTLFSAMQLKRPDTEGVLITTVRPGGPIAEAKPRVSPGDVITAMNGQAVADVAQLRRLTAQAVGDSEQRVPVLLTYERGPEQLLTVVRVGREEPPLPPRRARKAWLAVETQVLTRELVKQLGMDRDTTGVRITQLHPGYSAQKAGLRVGDLLLKVDGTEIDASEPEDADVLKYMVRQYRIGSKVTLDVIRDGTRKKIDVTLDEPPAPPSEFRRYEDAHFEFAARELAHRDRISRQLDPDTRGVLIVQVARAGWAALGGMQSGDVVLAVEGRRIIDVDDLEEAMEGIAQRKPKRVVFFLRRGIHTGFVSVGTAWDDR